MNMQSDTIAAVSTPMGEGGIAIIRVSGPEAIDKVDRIFMGKRKLAHAPTHTINYGFICEPETKRKVEEVLVSVMRAPRSFTAEDVVEINCHGGIVPVRIVLDLLLEQGIRLAEPGEFTKRAFLNGRIDLSQAEAVIDLIRAKSDRAHRIALKQSEGLLSGKIKQLRQQLLELMAHIEVNIDYPEHDAEELTIKSIQNHCEKAMKEIETLLLTARQGKVLREGIITAIIGRPNVGKSSLLNLLAQENKAIVTDIPGTTRDVIEEFVQVNGIPLRLLDTAGLRETDDAVEKIGVEKTRNVLSEADLILLLLNYSEPLHEEDISLLNQLKNRNTIIVFNKIDLPRRIETEYVESLFPKERIVHMSVLRNEGLEQLQKAITGIFFEGQVQSDDLTYVSNARHIQLLKQAHASLRDALEAAKEAVPVDIIQIDIHTAWEKLGEIIGDAVGESLIDQIFSQFCLGK